MGHYLKKFSEAVQGASDANLSSAVPRFAEVRPIQGEGANVSWLMPLKPTGTLRVLYFITPDVGLEQITSAIISRNFKPLCKKGHSLFDYYQSMIPLLSALVFSGEWCVLLITNSAEFDVFPQYPTLTGATKYVTRSTDQKYKHTTWSDDNWLQKAVFNSWNYVSADPQVDAQTVWLMGMSGAAYMCSSLMHHWKQIFQGAASIPRIDHVFLVSGASMGCFAMGFLENQTMVENLIQNPYKSTIGENVLTAATSYDIDYYRDRVGTNTNSKDAYWTVCPKNFSEVDGGGVDHPHVYLAGHKMDSETSTSSGEHFMHQYMRGLHPDVREQSHAVEIKSRASWRKRMLHLKCNVPVDHSAKYHALQSVNAANILEILHCRTKGISSKNCKLSVEKPIVPWWTIMLLVITSLIVAVACGFLVWSRYFR